MTVKYMRESRVRQRVTISILGRFQDLKSLAKSLSTDTVSNLTQEWTLYQAPCYIDILSFTPLDKG